MYGLFAYLLSFVEERGVTALVELARIELNVFDILGV
jgi:hypothetical protein